MAELPRLLLCVLCDDVRVELQGKHSLMGLFDAFNVLDFTQPLPGFHIYARIALTDEEDHRLIVRVASSEDDFRVELQGEVRAATHSEVHGAHVATVNMGIGGMRVPRPGMYHVSFLVDGRDLGGSSFLVKAAKPPTLQ